MAFLRDRIENVRARFLPDGIAADGRRDMMCRAAVVTWRSTHTGMLHQVYVNNHLAAVTHEPGQRRVVVQIPGSFQSATSLEVVAVEPEDACIDFGRQLNALAPAEGRLRLTLLRSQSLPLDGTANVYFDDGTGQIDYAQPLNTSPIRVWPCRQDKAGFGMSRFGESDFGYDSAAAIGFGKGRFGHGQFGLDADAIEWIGPPLSAGLYRFGVKITDSHGNVSTASETGPVTIMPAATPAARLEVGTLDPKTAQLTLRVSNTQ